MPQNYDITRTIKQIQAIINVETKSIKQKGTAGEGKLVALAKLCNSLHNLVSLTAEGASGHDPAEDGDPRYRNKWGLE